MQAPFIKVFYPRDFDSLIVGNQAAAIVDVHSRGIDSGWMRKQAAAGIFKDLDIAPEKGHSFIHLIALGDAEKYAGNRNGDIFYGFPRHITIPYPEKGVSRDLQVFCGNADRVSTFEKHAKVYRNHVNKKNSPSYGDIVKAAHNRDMGRGELIIRVKDSEWADDIEKLAAGKPIDFSMAARVPYDTCVPPGTRITTPGGRLPIESIAAGTRVLTHTGTYREVTAVMQRTYSGCLCRLEIFGLPRDLVATANHPVLLTRQAAVRACHGSTGGQRRRHTLAGEVCTTCGAAVDVSPRWADMSDVRIGDYVVAPVLPPGTTYMSVDEAYCTGFYAGDGVPVRQRSGRKKDKGIPRLVAVQYSLDGTDGKLVSFLLSRVSSVVGRDVKAHPDKRNKGTTVSLYSAAVAARIVAACGEKSGTKHISPAVFAWCRAARIAFIGGCLDSDGSIDAASGQARYCSTSADLAADVQQLLWGLGICASLHREGATGGYGSLSDMYVVAIPASAMSLFSDVSVRAARHGRQTKWSRSAMFISGGLAYLPVLGAEAVAVRDYAVHNLSVAEDESYVAAGVAVHNCSFCGHRARSRDEYCDHAKDHLTAITKEGHQIGVINDYHTFFDISRVPVRADRIAQGLLKAAAAEPTSRDLLTEMEFNPPPAYEGIANDFTRMKKLSVLQRMAAIEKEIEARGDSILGDATAKSLVKATLPDLAKDDMALLAGGSSDTVEHKLAALADAKVILSLGDFMKVVAGQSNAEHLAPETSAAEAKLPGIFGRMLSSSDVEDMLDGTLFDDTTLGVVPQKIKDLVGSLARTHGRSGDAARRRVTITVVRALPAGRKQEKDDGQEKTAAFSKAAGRIAEEYAKYLLAVCARGDNVENRMLTESAIMQHYVC